ncbi:MAG: hypothetical protein MRY79_06780 [Alphaproteobacteria bacterium]|nr:hypothetical protein [Alphaproteobacteria bacterium]
MSIVLLHDLDNEKVLINLDRLNAAKRRIPDENSMIKEPFTKLFYATKDGTMEALGFPDAVKESPQEIYELMLKSR